MTEIHDKLDEITAHLTRRRAEQIQMAHMQKIQKRTTGGPSIRGKIDRIVQLSSEILRGPPGARKKSVNFPYHMIGTMNAYANTRPNTRPHNSQRKRRQRWRR